MIKQNIQNNSDLRHLRKDTEEEIRNEIHAQNERLRWQLVEIENKLKDVIYTHNIKSLSTQEPTVRKLVLETCNRKSLTLQKDLSFKLE